MYTVSVALTLSFSPSKQSSCVPSTPLAVNSAAYWSMSMDTNHRHTCWLLHSRMGRLCHRLLLMVGTGSPSNVCQRTQRRNKRKLLKMRAARHRGRPGNKKKRKKKRDKGRGGHTHLSGRESESVRVSRQGEIRDMTHHAGAAHRRANTLEVRKQTGCLHGCWTVGGSKHKCMHYY